LNEVSRDNGKRRIYVEANVSGRDWAALSMKRSAKSARR
jgi:cobalt-zinc-cadmium resistance protein CzcA